MISKEELADDVQALNYRSEILEKVYQLLSVMKEITKTPYLNERLVLKGGTALNLFFYDCIPRLSVDADLNYIGYLSKEKMREDRPIINEAMDKILIQLNMTPSRKPTHYAGGKMIWRYVSVLGQNGNLELDLNYMYRRPLWPSKMKSPKLARFSNLLFPVLDIHELAAGKFSALLDRDVARDLFDSHQLFMRNDLDKEKLKQAFVVYLGMRKKSWQETCVDDIHFSVEDIRHKLIPVLQADMIPGTKRPDIEKWGLAMMEVCREGVGHLLAFNDNEKEFLTRVQTHGEIKAELLSSDPAFCAAVKEHPALQWRAKQALVA